jgi:dolichol-phosphate mannosyltransferase
MIHIVLPAYDEERALPALLDALDSALGRASLEYRVVVVDDGSTDSTAALAAAWGETHPLDLLRHPRNRGLGAAMGTGLAHVARRAGDDDWVVALDADGTHGPEFLPALVAEGTRQGWDLVIASRFAPGGREVGVAAYRWLLSRGASAALRLAFRLPPGVRDVSTGFKAYRGSLLRRLASRWGERLIEEQGFACMAELLVKAAALGASIGEVPMVLRYDLKAGPSKMRTIPTVRAYLRLLRRRREFAAREPASPR